MRLIAFIEYAAVLIGILAILAGQFFALPKGLHLGVFMTGAGIALGGAEAAVTRRMCFRASEEAFEDYAGLPALIVGMLALLVGAAVIAAAYLLADNLWQATLSYLARRPAAVLVAAGLFVLGIGVLMTLNPRGRSGIAWALFIYGPRALFGAAFVIAGLACIGLGAWEWLDPRGFDRFVHGMRFAVPPNLRR